MLEGVIALLRPSTLAIRCPLYLCQSHAVKLRVGSGWMQLQNPICGGCEHLASKPFPLAFARAP